MPHTVFVWEIGSGFGHLTPIAALGRELVRRGHRVSALVPASETARALLGQAGISQLPMPPCPAPARAFALSPNYSANLLRNGYWHSATVAQRVHQCQQALQQLQPDLMIADHAPAALLASRGARFARAAMGNGFTLPPLATPMPAVQPWFALKEAQLATCDKALLDGVNPALPPLGLAPLPSVAGLFDDVAPLLYVEAELDHYPAREHAHYYGTLAPATPQPPCPLPADGAPFVFVYLSSNNRFLQPVMQALLARGVNVVAYIAGRSETTGVVSDGGGSVLYLDAPVDLSRLAGSCVLAITHGGTATAALMLKQGIPQLCCPLDLEKAVLASRLQQRGLALSANWFAPDSRHVIPLVHELLDGSRRPPQLDAFGARPASSGSEQLDLLAQHCENLL